LAGEAASIILNSELSTSHSLRFARGSVFELLENVPGEILVDLAVTGNRLTGACSRILIPIVPAAVADEDAAALLNLPDEVQTFHAIWRSATWRTPGTFPAVRSS